MALRIAVTLAGFVTAVTTFGNSAEPEAAIDNLSEHFRGTIQDVTVVAPAEKPQADDLDLTQMAKDALNYLRGNPEPQRNYECRFSLGPLGIPCHVPLIPSNRWGYDPVSLGDTDSRMELQYVRIREMAGVPEADDVERGVKARIRAYRHDDGLCWVNPGACVGQPVEGEWVITWTTAKLMISLADDFRRSGDPATKVRARTTFMALKKLALWDGPRAYFPGIAPYKDGQWLRDGWCATHARNYPFIVEPCVYYGECTHDAEALEFAKAVADGFLAGSQRDQGELRIDPATGAFQNHVHLHTHAVWGVAHLGAVLHEARYIEWARKTYEFVLSQGTDFGWYPEFIPQGEYRTEICVVGDMLGIGAWLARAGSPHYWDHVERTVRNELRRSQFFITPEFERLFRQVHADKSADTIAQALRDLKRIEGGFVAQATFNDWVSYPDNPKLGTPGLGQNGIQMMGCCSPEGMHGLWEAWDGVVEEVEGRVVVNMAISRDHPAAKVTAYRPADGRIEVLAKRAGTYLVRPPAWADRQRLQLVRGGQRQPMALGGPAKAYVQADGVQPGETLVLSWPVPRFTQTFSPKSVPGRSETVTVRWLGNEVRSVAPRGKYLPMFVAE